MKRHVLRILFLIFFVDVGFCCAIASDWPMWRRDAGRTAVSPDRLSENLTLRWMRRLPPLRPAYRSGRLQFDAGYEPVVSGGLVIVGSSLNDSVTAFDAKTGEQRWRIFADGPVRFAPAVWKDRVFFGSDDGQLYCVRRDSGELIRKFRAVPSRRKLLGNRRMISVWPVRGGPVVADDQIYFAAGVWPMEGVFVYCLDADSGNVVWLNDRLGHRFGQHPHGTQAIGGLAPQGYLVVNGNELVVPCSTAYPARLDRQTGELIEFQLPSTGRFPGGWFAALDVKTARDIRRGRLTFDDVVNRQQHEDKEHKGDGDPGISRVVRTSDREWKFDDGFPGVEGTIHSMLTAEGRLFVVSRSGSLYCYDDAGQVNGKPLIHPRNDTPAANAVKTRAPDDNAGGNRRPGHRGHALVVGIKDANRVRLMAGYGTQVLVIEPDGGRVERLRQELDSVGLYGSHVAILQSEFRDAGLPPYFASLITTETSKRFAAGFTNAGDDQGTADAAFGQLVDSLRPFGGVAILPLSLKMEQRLKTLIERTPMSGFQASISNLGLAIRRPGPLPGSTNYHGDWKQSRDQRVRFPLGVLWFDDTLGHFKRSPQPRFIDGVMVSHSKDWRVPMIKGLKGRDYPLNEPVLSDVYTGRILDPDEAAVLRASLAPPDRGKREPSQYRPPSQKDDWKPGPPRPGRRVNPLTGDEEVRTFPKTYGCDGGVDYGDFFTMRSGTAAFYDKTAESGTVFISGPRSGCTNSVIPANGLLNVPYYYEGCTCSYPLPVALSLVPMPEHHEQWSSWGDGNVDAIQRIGINFGAPGDRITRDGTLWLDFPSVGGPSPEIDVAISPESTSFRYRHSVFVKSGRGWPWILASTAEGLRQFTLKNLKSGRYTVRLFFAETADSKPGERIQAINLQKQIVERELDIVKESGGQLHGLVREFNNIQIDGTFHLSLTASRGRSLISGIEIIANGLQWADVPVLN